METKKTEKIMEASRNTGRVLVKGSGDLASGIALRLYRAGFQILMTELAVPTTVRRTVAFSPAVYLGRMRWSMPSWQSEILERTGQMHR